MEPLTGSDTATLSDMAKNGGPSLIDELRAAAVPRRMACRFAAIYEALSDADAADLRAALADETIPTSAIARVLAGRGHEVSGHTVGRHRRGECRCP